MTNTIGNTDGGLVGKIKEWRFDGDSAGTTSTCYGADMAGLIPSENLVTVDEERVNVPTGKGFFSWLKRTFVHEYAIRSHFKYVQGKNNADAAPHITLVNELRKSYGIDSILGLEPMVSLTLNEKQEISADLELYAYTCTRPTDFDGYPEEEVKAEAEKIMKDAEAKYGWKMQDKDARSRASENLYDQRIEKGRKDDPIFGWTTGSILFRMHTKYIPQVGETQQDPLATLLAGEICQNALEKYGAHLNQGLIEGQINETLKLFNPAYRAAKIAGGVSQPAAQPEPGTPAA